MVVSQIRHIIHRYAIVTEVTSNDSESGLKRSASRWSPPLRWVVMKDGSPDTSSMTGRQCVNRKMSEDSNVRIRLSKQKRWVTCRQLVVYVPMYKQQCIMANDHLHSWHEPLGVHSAKRRHQSPEWTAVHAASIASFRQRLLHFRSCWTEPVDFGCHM